MNNILLNDVGFRDWGWAVVEIPTMRIVDHGTIQTKPAKKKLAMRKADDDAQCTQQLFIGVTNIIVKHGIKGMMFEMPNAGARGARPIVGMARSSAVAACLECAMPDIPSEYFPPSCSKELVRDKGAVTKEEVEAHVKSCFLQSPEYWEDWTAHEFDALATILVAKKIQSMMLKLLTL